MVRLKVRNYEQLKAISKFQFLMVRLKAEPEIINNFLQRNFNSLWCD